jgi:homoserine O-acetyltransferase
MMRNAIMRAATVALLSIVALAAHAADYPAPQSGDWTAHDFRFHTGQTIAGLHLHYTTVGASTGEPVLILHGTGGTGSGMLTPAFAGLLFGPGQPLDASKYFIILPDTIGTGQSTKPSDGLRARFPEYDYDDLVLAQYRMETWVWGVAYPGFMDSLVPMASQPTAMAARNWMLRRMLIESIRQDPAYQGGNYTTQPPSLRLANVLFGLATNGGTLALQAQAPTHALANKVVDDGLAAKPPADANDFIYQWNASADYDPEPMLGRIEAPVLAINSADDERNPPQTGVTDKALTQVKSARLYLIPASPETHGHGTTGYAKFWAPQLADFLATLPHRPVGQ